MAIQVKLCCLLQVSLGYSAPNSPELSLLKLLPLTYYHSHFLATTLDFTSFFTMAFFGAAPFFTAWLLLISYHFFLYLYIAYGWLWGFLNLSFFLYHKRLNDTSSIFDFISNYTNYLHISKPKQPSCKKRVQPPKRPR